MTVALEEIIKQEDLDVAPQRMLFKDLVSGGGRNKSGEFLPLGSDVRKPKGEEPPEEPVISQEELDRQRREIIDRETYAKAFAAAEKAAMALGEQMVERELARILPQFESVLRQLDGLPQRVFAGAERFLVETVITLMGELFAHELSVNPQGIANRVQRLLEQSAGRRDIVIYVSPDAVELLQRLGKFEALRIEADPTVAPGSVRMESDFGGLEDNLPQQLADMMAGIRAIFNGRLKTSGCDDVSEVTEDILAAASILPPTVEEAVTEEAVTEEAVTEEAVTEAAVAEAAVAEEAVAEEAVAEEDSPEQPLPQESLYEESEAVSVVEKEPLTGAVPEALAEEIAEEGATDGPPMAMVSPSLRPEEPSLDETLTDENGVVVTEDETEVLSVEELTAGFANMDLPEGSDQPAWLSEENEEPNDDEIS